MRRDPDIDPSVRWIILSSTDVCNVVAVESYGAIISAVAGAVGSAELYDKFRELQRGLIPRCAEEKAETEEKK